MQQFNNPKSKTKDLLQHAGDESHHTLQIWLGRAWASPTLAWLHCTLACVCLLACIICTICEQPVFVCHGLQLPFVRYLLRVSFTPMLRSDSSPSPTIDPRFSPCDIFKHTHLKFKIYSRKQASKHTHACAQCSHASVGRAPMMSYDITQHTEKELLHYTIPHEHDSVVPSLCLVWELWWGFPGFGRTSSPAEILAVRMWRFL